MRSLFGIDRFRSTIALLRSSLADESASGLQHLHAIRCAKVSLLLSSSAIRKPKVFSRKNLGVNKPNTDGDRPSFY
jgi:hypothetical protein